MFNIMYVYRVTFNFFTNHSILLFCVPAFAEDNSSAEKGFIYIGLAAYNTLVSHALRLPLLELTLAEVLFTLTDCELQLELLFQLLPSFAFVTITLILKFLLYEMFVYITLSNLIIYFNYNLLHNFLARTHHARRHGKRH